ncbi:DUF2026 domain-containing protein [Octadecabacter sp. SW4]|uniref:DUF2026 family protein n=1 Tax=Octadecabacter sp. SW4 TaxID=2602067 RepID=UPI0011C1F780|nr:DUF2026 family protein [Octadecabacter sp. SW4]QEE34534.1 DUF2026 domain-containing protein [Octadecabacter sp. SW4]
MLIKRNDYERIYQLIAAVVESEDGSPAHACMNFSIFGAHILAEHFKLSPSVKCGLAAFHLGGDNDVLCFGELRDEGVTFSEDGFHCWIEADGWIIDFMAPQFAVLSDSTDAAEPRMFQKKSDLMALDPSEIRSKGDFFLKHDQYFAESLLMPHIERPDIQDLAEICSNWFRKTPLKIPQYIATMDKGGRRRDIVLKPKKLRSNW